MKDSIEHLLQQIHTLSNNMRSLIGEKQFDNLVELEAQRRELINTLFSEEIPPNKIQAIKEFIEDLMQSDKKLLELAKELKEEASDQLSSLDSGTQAVQQYLDNSR
ncbi:MAG: flagellar protein FliT [Gammaproteobacteria bacterium]|nr:flagellar protein FliT [Gammaproteobacteria bacterium]MDH5728326.1 flagellar protein FliT [Gammaproteobacteria bacterium]